MKLGVFETLFLVVLLGVILGSYQLGVRRMNARTVELRATMDAKRQDLENLRAATQGIDDLNRKIDEIQKAIEFFESKLPAEKEVDKILQEVWQMAEANALQTRTVKTLRSEAAANYSEQPIQMNLSGDFNGFYAFLLQLEKLPRITRINQMKLEKIDDQDGEMQAQVTLSIFFEPEASTSTAIH